MKVKYEVIFRRGKSKRIILSKKDTPEEAEKFINRYAGHHDKSKMYLREKKIIENPYRKRRMRKAS